MEPSKKSSSSKHNTYNNNNNIPDQATTNAYNFWTNSHLIYPDHQQQPHNYPMSSNCTQNSAFGFDLNNEDDDEGEQQQLITINDHQDIYNNNNKDQERRLRRPELVVDYNGGGGEEEEEEEEIKKQPLFEKALTPSDVGKLNRLVIPKQHAEKYFPLNGSKMMSAAADSGVGEKGVLLSFEDELGKAWRFRYSYWNSSQSYVLTKGWSRFVKEKKLDAGDIVLFQSHPLDPHRLFIGWRKRNITPPLHHLTPPPAAAAACNTTTTTTTTSGSGSGWTRLFFPAGHPYPPPPPTHTTHGPPLSLPYQPDSCLLAGRVLQSQTMMTTTTTGTPASGSATSKRLRLFGVNLDLELCQQQQEEEEEEEEEEVEDYSDDQPPTHEEGSSGSSQQTHHHHNQPQYQYNYQQHYFTNRKLHHTHMDMDMNFSRDVNQTRYHQG